ncbi:MAG: hypothetical protein WAM66_12845 [Acidobacteriaceae bacterium]
MLRRFFLTSGRPFRTAAGAAAFLAVATVGALAQRAPGIFVTPIPNAPFTGTVLVQRSFIQHNGTFSVFKSMRVIARDSHGRIHNEARELVPLSSTVTPQVLRIHLYDPQTRVSTMLYPQQRMFRTGMVSHPPETEPPGLQYASPAGSNLPLSQYTKEEDLGTHEMDGLQVHGVRETQKIPAAGGTGKAVVVTDEYWYSDYLHINVVIKHIDPRAGSRIETVTQISQDEPDPSLFAIPAGYKQVGVVQ